MVLNITPCNLDGLCFGHLTVFMQGAISEIYASWDGRKTILMRTLRESVPEKGTCYEGYLNPCQPKFPWKSCQELAQSST